MKKNDIGFRNFFGYFGVTYVQFFKVALGCSQPGLSLSKHFHFDLTAMAVGNV